VHKPPTGKMEKEHGAEKLHEGKAQDLAPQPAQQQLTTEQADRQLKRGKDAKKARSEWQKRKRGRPEVAEKEQSL